MTIGSTLAMINTIMKLMIRNVSEEVYWSTMLADDVKYDLSKPHGQLTFVTGNGKAELFP